MLMSMRKLKFTEVRWVHVPRAARGQRRGKRLSELSHSDTRLCPSSTAFPRKDRFGYREALQVILPNRAPEF
eukprot:scaffold26637_cov220-Skeletonema_menzelii.AAC.4